MATKKFPNVELLDARIASVLNQTIQNSHFEKKVSLENSKPKNMIGFYEEDRSLSWSTTTVLDYADLFSITIRNDNFQDSDTR